MTLTNIAVLLGGVVLIAGIAWFFWGPRKSGQRAALTSSGYQEAMVLVVLGLGIGVPLSLAGSRFLHSFLFGVNGTDPVSFCSVILLLGAVAALAGFVPARRAAHVDPIVALRYE